MRRIWTPLRRFSSEAPRINPVGIQYLSNQLQLAVFPQNPVNKPLSAAAKKRQKTSNLLLNISKSHLKHHQLLGKKTTITSPIDIANVPHLVGKTLDEHFWNLGVNQSHQYYQMAENLFSNTIPLVPKEWEMAPGWTRYAPGHPPELVEYPMEDALVFDVEVMYKMLNYPVLATCALSKAWYGWVLPVIGMELPTERDFCHLLPFNSIKNQKLLVGYNVLYDRARCLDEYNLHQLKAFYLDAMSLHIAVLGICLRQRPKWVKHQKLKQMLEDEDEFEPDSLGEYANKQISAEIDSDLVDDPWLDKGLTNSLANVFEFHIGEKLSKDARQLFSNESLGPVVENFQEAMNYCASDVSATFQVARKLWPEFCRKIPHPVLFAALRNIGQLILPTTRQWDDYISTAEAIYEENRKQLLAALEERAHELVAYVTDPNQAVPDWENDPWLCQLDWTIKLPRLKKDGSPVKRQAFLTGYPQWYRDLHKGKELNITLRSRITPLLLRLNWEGYPVRWTDLSGWCFFVGAENVETFKGKSYIEAKLSDDEFMTYIEDLRPPGKCYEAFKVPHPDGGGKRCTMMLSKRFLPFFAKGIITLEYGYALDIVSLNNAVLYWMGNRQRIIDQWVVFTATKKLEPEVGLIIPQICTMGTITRRATENTWLTASNAKKDRVGLELKLMIKAPPGWCFVGADVDLEELWIALLLGDAIMGVHGGTALGWMTLEGDKLEGTDLHLKTASILGISRGDAKVFNYGRIYGAGVKFATQLLKQCNPALSDKEAEATAMKLYDNTKGMVCRSLAAFTRPVYHGGTELIIFNTLELIAHLDDPRTPVLGASITDALTGKHLKKNNYITLRINWTIQSLGVDYLHLLVVLMDYLMETYKVSGRLAITVHDELRYLVKWEDRYLVALLLQVANLWTRAMFCEQVGIKELPQLVAFFSEVDIDTVLRKEVLLDCVTPLNPMAIPPGELVDIHQLLAKVALPPVQRRIKKPRPYVKRVPTMQVLTQEIERDPPVAAAKIELQNLVDKTQWRQNMGVYQKLRLQTPKTTSSAVKTTLTRKLPSVALHNPQYPPSTTSTTARPVATAKRRPGWVDKSNPQSPRRSHVIR